MQIRPFAPSDTEQIVSVMCSAFRNDPLYRFFIEEEAARTKFLRKFMKFRLRFGVKKGKVYVNDDCQSVAIWILPDHIMTPADLILCGGLFALLGCSGAQRKRIMQFNNFADAQAAQAITQPCWHLSPICVAPAQQGKGYGGALIRHGLAEVAKSGQPCYLETQSSVNVKIYQTCGFQLVGETAADGSDLRNYGMIWRKAPE